MNRNLGRVSAARTMPAGLTRVSTAAAPMANRGTSPQFRQPDTTRAATRRATDDDQDKDERPNPDDDDDKVTRPKDEDDENAETDPADTLDDEPIHDTDNDDNDDRDDEDKRRK